MNKTSQSVILVPSYISGNIIETPLARRSSVDKVEHIGLTFLSYFKVCSVKQDHERYRRKIAYFVMAFLSFTNET